MQIKRDKLCKLLRSLYANPFIPISILFVILKLFLVSDQPLFAFSIAVHDDRLFMTYAENILKGEWLGNYNNLTLAKGSFYSIWIVLSFLAGIPLLLSQHLLYILGCFVFIKAIKPLTNNQWFHIFAFAFLLFNPISYSYDPFTRVIREGLYLPLTILVFSSAIGLFLRRKSYRKSMLWAIMTGVSLSAFWLTREEGIWILPLLLLLNGYHIVELIIEKKKLDKASLKKVALHLTPFLFLSISVLLVSFINYRYYGVFTTVEFKSEGFTSAYGALTRVSHKNWRADVPVPKATREEIYKVSPAFKELQPYLEGTIGEGWRNNSNSDEIRGGWLMWALRDSVAAAGYYESAPKAEEYYTRLALEVNQSCDKKLLDCPFGERATMQPPWDNRYFEPLTKTIARATLFVAQFNNFTPIPLRSIGDTESMIIFRDFTRENVNPTATEQLLPKQTILSDYKTTILNHIGQAYIFFNPLLFLVSLASLSYISIRDLKAKKISSKTVVAVGIFSILMVRIALISFLHVSSFESIIVLYLSPAYVVMSAFIIVSLIRTESPKFLDK